MLWRLLLAFSVLGSLASACTCYALPAKTAKEVSEIVFRGTVVMEHEGKWGRVAVFRVSRVWKGQVPETLELPVFQIGCGIGFQSPVEIGQEWLVFAGRLASADNDFVPGGCTTQLANNAQKLLKDLGPGRKLKSKPPLP